MILVTGATGLLGSHLVLHLVEKGQNVKAMFRNEKGQALTKQVFEHYKKTDLWDKIHWVKADILDISSLEIAFQEVDSVYHCAGLISFDPKDENKLRKINIEGTANIVNFCIDYNIKKLCHVSSIAANGDLAPHETTITETTEWNPEKQHSDYAISKYGAEMEVWRAAQEGLNVVVVNPGVILGPLFWNTGSGDIYKRIKNGLSFYTKGSTGFVTVNDVVTIMFQLMQAEVSAEKFTIIAENKPYKEIVFTIADVLKVKRPKYYANSFLTGLTWKVDWFLSTFFNKKRSLSKDMNSALHCTDNYSNEKIVTLLQYPFEDIDTYLKKLNP
jgi:dihydroflavonol-4-reductase